MSDLDALMSADPLSLSAQDIDQIILYQRRHRANVEGGKKAVKEAGPKASLQGILDGLVKAKPVEPMKRRI